MPWEPPIFRARAQEEYIRKVEKLPDPLPEPYYDPPMTYYNNNKSSLTATVLYDLFYNFEEGYNPKLARDDGISMESLFEGIYKEEENKYIPVTSQLWYGRPLLHKTTLDWIAPFSKVCATKDFYRSQGINISPELEQQPQH